MALRMLVGVDDSPYARAAMSVALQVAKRVPGCELSALHVVNVVAPSGSFFKDLPGRLGFEPAVVSRDIEQEYDSVAEKLLADLKAMAEASGVKLRTVIEHGAVVSTVLHHAGHVDLLFIGNRGHTETRFPGQGGANVYNIVSKLTIPVVLVPQGVEQVTGVVLGYDGSAAANHAASAIRRIADKVKFTVHVVYVDKGGGTDPAPVLAEAERQLLGADVVTHVIEAASVREGIVSKAEQVGANLLALGFSGKHRVRDFLFGSSSEYLMQDKNLMLLLSH